MRGSESALNHKLSTLTDNRLKVCGRFIDLYKRCIADSTAFASPTHANLANNSKIKDER